MTLCPWARHFTLLASGECPCTYCKSLWMRASSKLQKNLTPLIREVTDMLPRVYVLVCAYVEACCCGSHTRKLGSARCRARELNVSRGGDPSRTAKDRLIAHTPHNNYLVNTTHFWHVSAIIPVANPHFNSGGNSN